MPVIGLNYRKIHAERAGAFSKVDISTTPKITDVKKSKLSGFGPDVDILSIDFEFLSKFEPNAGEVSIAGTMVYKTENVEDAFKMWKKERKIPIEMNTEIINYIFGKVGILALMLSDALQMPPVIGMPRIKAPEKN